MNESLSSPPSPSQLPRTRRGLYIAGAIAGLLVLLIGVVHAAGAGWHHGWGGPMGLSPERIEHGVKYLLSETDATADQKAKITAIMQAAAADVHAMHTQHGAMRQELHDILSAETIDRARLESLREEHLQLADQASKRFIQGVADAAEVLTPQQRAQLIQQVEQHHPWRQD